MFLVGKQVNHFHSAGILEESRDGQSDTLHCSGLWCGLSGGTWTSDDCDINKYTKMDFDQTFIEMMRAVR